MGGRVGERIRAYGQRRDLGRYEFDRVCRVVFVSRAEDFSGDAVGGAIGFDDLVVVGLVSMGTSFRGIVRFAELNALPANPIHRGHRYRFQSNDVPKFGRNAYGVFRIENIVPAKSLRLWLLKLFGY